MRSLRSPVHARLGAAAASALLIAATVPLATAPVAAAERSDTVVMSVLSVSPPTPPSDFHLRPLTVRLSLENRTGKDITGVRIVGERGEPIGNQRVLDQSLAAAAPPSSSGLPIAPTHPVTVDLPADSTVTATFATTTSASTDAGLCICHDYEIYPLFFSAHVVGPGGVDQRLGVVGTYLPAFGTKPAPVQVSWVWPLLEAPHRLFGDTTFSDDLLAASVSGGRLSRALDVAEQVGDTVPITLLIDPELLDELQVMATGRYTVVIKGHSQPGTGGPAAAGWLERLRAVLADPDVQLQLTPYADPDVETLTARGLTWSSQLPAAMVTRVDTALGGHPADTTVAWPAAGAVSAATLRVLAGTGVSTLILDSGAVRPTTDAGAVPAGLARLDAGPTDVAAALTTPAVENYAAKVISDSGVPGAGVAYLPQLIAEIAIRAVQEPQLEHAVTITPPRYVDPDVTSAVQAIKATSRSNFAEPISLRDAVRGTGTLLPTGRSRLAAVPASAGRLAPESLDAVAREREARPNLSSLLGSANAGAKTLLNSLPIAAQRAASSAWLSQTGAKATGLAYAGQLTAKIDSLTTGVHIISPHHNAYTLASNSSPLPITVENELAYPVTIRIQVSTVVNGLPGFTTKDIGLQRIESNQKRTLNIPTKTERSGRILVEARLLTPNDKPLGDPVSLTVRSTALGVIGVVITIVAGVVLALALLVRFGRRLHQRRSSDAARVEAKA